MDFFKEIRLIMEMGVEDAVVGDLVDKKFPFW